MANGSNGSNDHIVKAYIAYSRFTAILAFALPPALLLSSFLFDGGSLKESLSAYYHGDVDLQRNLFVGVLCAVAGFMALYKGWRGWEANLLNVAGVAAVFVAFVPTPKTSTDDFLSGHGIAATVLFGCIVAVGVVLPWFRKRAGRSNSAPPVTGYVCSALTIGLGAVLAVLGRTTFSGTSVFLWGEVFLVIGFGVFWMMRTRHLSEPSLRASLLAD